MSTIELIPETGGRSIAGEFQSPLLYLMAVNGGFRWVSRMESDAMPILVATHTSHGVAFAPLHPMCHLGTETGVVTQKQSGDVIQIGVTNMQIHLSRSRRWRLSGRRALIACTLGLLFMIGGWCLRGLVSPASPVAASALEDPYVF